LVSAGNPVFHIVTASVTKLRFTLLQRQEIDMTRSAKLISLTPLCALLATGSVYATNGMLMEGYGPISSGMGGASQAIDHGNAAMSQNPATLGMMADGTARLDVAIGFLGPDVASSFPAMGLTAKSGGTSYLMPALGYVKRNGAYTYGIGMFAQGGMGTEYDATSFMSAPAGVSSAIPSRSELGVGNLIFPVAFQVSPDLTVGATLKFMWSSLDMKMTATSAQLGGMMQASGVAPTGAFASPQLQAVMGAAKWANISFSDDNAFTGAAKSTGYGASVGATYRVNKDVMLGGSFLLKSALGDMKTSPTAASMSLDGGGPAMGGQITIFDFQMPSILALGTSWQASPSLLLAAEFKSIGWSDSMKSFKMRFDNATGSANFTMQQDWRDQTVLNFGLAWKANEAFTLRAGLNLADNPIPDSYVNPLFPATVKNHVALGFGYKVAPAGDFNMSLTMAPKVTVTTPQGIDISHAQTNMQFMYSHRF
jgi:long-chain fatty acid transport protein